MWSPEPGKTSFFFQDDTSNAIFTCSKHEFYKHAHDSAAIELFSVSQLCDGLKSDITISEHL